MADTTRAEYLTSLLSQKRQNSQQGGNIVNQGDGLSSSDSSNGSGFSWKKIGGAVDSLVYDDLWAGAASFFEGWADLAATGIGALGDLTGWYDSKPFTDWAKHDVAGQFGQYMKTYGSGKALIKAFKGELDGDFMGDMYSGLANVFTGANDEEFEKNIQDNYLYDESNFMTDNEIGQFAGGIVRSIGEMLPSIAIGNIAGAAGAGEKTAKAIGTVAMSGAAGGNSASDALGEGASAGQALGYGAASGAVEFGTEYIPWEKIPGLGKILGENVLPGVGLRSFSAKAIAKSMAQEGLEEVVSEMTNPILQCLTYKGTDALKQYDFVNNPEEAGEFYKGVLTSFISGAITGGIMEGVNMGSNSKRYGAEGVDYINGLTEYAKEFDAIEKRAQNVDSDYAKGKITSEARLDALDEMATQLKEIDSKAQSVSELWEKIPDDKKANVTKLVMDPSQWAEYSKSGKESIEAKRNASGFEVLDKNGRIKTVRLQDSGSEGTQPMSFNLEAKAAADGTQVESDSKIAYNGAYEDEFARLQSESRAMPDEESRAFHSGERAIDDGVRARLSGILERRIESGSRSGGYGDASLVNEKTGNALNLKTNVDAETFHDVFEIAQKYLPKGDAVDVHDVADYKNNRNFLSKDGLSGFSITPDGDLISVFNMGERGFLQTIKKAISENGAKTLDCFDSPIQHLPEIYEKTLGFKTASVMDFNYELLKSERGQAYADYFVKTYGESPVSFMVNTDADVETKHFTKDQYDDAKAYQMSFIGDDERSAVKKSASTDAEIADASKFLASQNSSEYVSVERGADGSNYVSIKGNGLENYDPRSQRKILRRYFKDNFVGKEYIVDGKTLTLSGAGAKKISIYTSGDITKVYSALDKVIENSRYVGRELNRNDKNGKNYVSYFSSKAEVNGSMHEYVIITKENGSIYNIYDVQQNKNARIIPSSEPARGGVDDSRYAGNSFPGFDTNVAEKTKNVKSSAKQGTESKPLSYEEKKKAYRKAEATYESNQQLLKDAAPSKTIDYKTAKNYASAEADLVARLINRDTGDDATFFFETSKTGRKFTAAVDTALSNEAALATLDAQFSDMLESAKVKIGSEKAMSLTEYASKESLDELREIAHSLHEDLLNNAKDSKIARERADFESKLNVLKERVANTAEMAKEVDRFNKNAEITKRQFKIDQTKYADEFKADATLHELAKTMPRYNVLQENGKRASDNNGLSLRKASYEKWANDSYETVKGLYDKGQLLNFDQAKANELFDAYDTVINGGDANSKSLTIEQVKAMTKITKLLRYQISEKAAAQRVEIRDAATKINTELSYRFEASPRSTGKIMKFLSTATYEQVKMLNYGDMIMGYDGSNLQTHMNSLLKAKAQYYKDYYDIKEKYIDTNDVKSLMKAVKGKAEINGRKYSKAELLDAYLMLTDSETRALMDANDAKKTRRIKFSDGSYIDYDSVTYESLEKAIGKDVADRAKKLLIEDFYNDHSEGSYLNRLRDWQLKMLGDTTVSDRTTDHYPRSQSSDVTSKASSVDSLKSNGGNSTASNGSVTKGRQSSQAIAVLQAMDPFTRADSYAKQVSNEINLRYQSNEFLRMMGMNVTGTDGKTTRMQMTLGDQFTGYLRDFVTSLNDIDLVGTDGLISKIQGGVTAATLGFSPINPVKNFLSIFKEGHEVGMANVAKAVLNPGSWANGELNRAIMETGTWKARYADGTLSMQANVEVKGKMASFGSKLTYLYTLADQATTLLQAQADYEYVRKANPGLTKAELVSKAVDLWESNVNRTQSTAERVGKSQSSSGRFFGKDSQIVKAAWTFQSDVVTGASMLVNDMSMLYTSGKVIKWANGVLNQGSSVSAEKIAYAKQMLAKATSTRNAILKNRLPAGAAAALLAGLLKYFIEGLNSKIKGKKGWDESLLTEDAIKETFTNAATSVVPFLETMQSAIEYNDGQPELFGLSGITSTLQALSELMNGKTRTGLIDLTKAITSFAGIPLKNIYDYTIGFASSFDPKVAIESKNLLYQSEKSQTSYSSNFSTALYERVGDVSDDCKTEIKTLYGAGYDSKPPSVYETYEDAKGNEVTISWSDKQTMRRYYQKANAKLAKMIKSDSYKQLDDSSKAKAIKKLYSAYRDASLAKVVTKKAPTSVATALAYANYSDLGTLLSAVAYISELEATKTATKKERAVSYVNSLKGLTKAQRMTILKMAGYTVDSSYVQTVLRQAGLSNDMIKKIAF